MTSDPNRQSWLRPILFGLLSQVLAFLASILATTIYATYLAFQVRGTPNQKLIGQFAASSLPWVTALVGIMLVLVFSLRIAKKSSERSVAAGIVVGISSAFHSRSSVAIYFQPSDQGVIAAIRQGIAQLIARCISRSRHGNTCSADSCFLRSLRFLAQQHCSNAKAKKMPQSQNPTLRYGSPAWPCSVGAAWDNVRYFSQIEN
jgi:hypothetical protein